MSSLIQEKHRNRTMLIVEGVYEKEYLFKSMLMAFNELSIDEDDVWVYKTNIYVLIQSIKNEYGENWYLQDIDLPLLVSRNDSSIATSYKSEFTDIYLIFDYERQDKRFVNIDIERMQSAFMDSTDNGKLYINYPMVEAYCDFSSIPDRSYLLKKSNSCIANGHEYKSTVENSVVKGFVGLPNVIEDILYTNGIENYKNKADMILKAAKVTPELIENIIRENNDNDFKFDKALCYLISAKYDEYVKGVYSGDYYSRLRNLYRYIILTSLQKIQHILGGYKELTVYDALDLLKEQNRCAADASNGYIWIVSTAVTIITDYNSRLINVCGKDEDTY